MTKVMTKVMTIAGLTHNQEATCPVCGNKTMADLFYDPTWLLSENQGFDPLMATCLDCKISKNVSQKEQYDG